jgi:hypothetical protein
MRPEPLSPLCYYGTDNCSLKEYTDVKPWVSRAIAQEEKNPDTRLWKKERSAEFQYEERLRRVRFFRKHEDHESSARAIADRLELCERYNRCCSGSCPECGRLIQRWFVRKSKYLLRDVIDKADHQLVAMTIVPAKPIIGVGNLHTLDIGNLRRRLIYALDKAGIKMAIGAIDFSYNEDKQSQYNGFWSAHFYIITSVSNRARVKKILKQLFPAKRRIPRPVKISAFDNAARRRSYAFKIQFNRRIGINAIKTDRNGITRKCRNTSRDKLRAAERFELFTCLDQIGFAERFIFRSVKPMMQSTKVKLRAIDA